MTTVSAQYLMKANPSDKKTSTETFFTNSINGPTWSHGMKISMENDNGTYEMHATILLPQQVTYGPNDGLFLNLSDGETIKLTTCNTGTATRPFSEGYEFDTYYILSSDDVAKLRNNEVTYFTITYSGGEYSRRTIYGKALISKLISLVD